MADISGETKVYTGRIIDVIHRHVKVKEGPPIEYEIVHRPKVSIIVALTALNDFVMVNQYRASINMTIWEFPGGTVEIGESPIEAAHRELEEETGYRASKMQPIGTFYTSPHFTDETIYLFLATDLIEGAMRQQEKESITVSAISEAQLELWLADSIIIDAKTIVSYMRYKQRRLSNNI